MPKGYWIARVDVHDAEAYKKYIAANAAPLAQFGARFLVRLLELTRVSARRKLPPAADRRWRFHHLRRL
jgi:uncharacterized protein (DUF1330 family)